MWFLIVSLYCYVSVVRAADLPTVDPADSWSTSGKCYPKSAISGTSSGGTDTFQTSLLCESACQRSAIIAIMGTSCFCSNSLPSSDDEVDISNCDITCNSLGNENCGGSQYYIVYENATPETVISASSSGTSTSTRSTSSSSTRKSSSSTSPKSSTPSTTSTNDATSSSTSTSTGVTSSNTSSPNIDRTTIVQTFTPNSQSTAVIVSTIITTPSATNSTPSPSSTDSSSPPASSSKSVSGGTIAGAVVGSIAGLALIAAAIFFLIMWRRKHANDSDVEDDFILSGPNEKNLQPDPNSSIAPNPFLLAGGYKFDNDQVQHQDDSSQQFVGVPSSSSDNSTSYGHSRQTSQLHGGSHGSNTGGVDYQSFDDVHYYDDNNVLSRPKMGSRKLSNGSLPDIKGTTRSLKVVNN